MASPHDSRTKFLSSTNANSLKAAIFHTMAFELSLEIKNDQIFIHTKRAFLKVLYNVCIIKKKHINFEQHARVHNDRPKKRLVRLYLTQSSYSTLHLQQKTIIFTLLWMKLVMLLIKCCKTSGTPKNLKFMIPTSIKLILLKNIHYTNFHRQFSLLFISLLENSSS